MQVYTSSIIDFSFDLEKPKDMILLMILSVFFVLASVLFLTLLFKWLCTFSAPLKKLPPSPPKFPIIGNLHQLGLYPHRSLQKFSEKYGSLMLLHLGSKPVLVASSADAAREIMKNNDLVFSNRPKLSIPDRLVYGSKDVAFAPYGEYWRQAKSVFVLQFLSNKRVQSFRRVREEETSSMIEMIRQKCSSSPSWSSPCTLVNLSDVFFTLTNDVLCRTALGRKYGNLESGGKIMAILEELTNLLGVFDIRDYIPWLGWINRFNGLDSRVEKPFKEIDDFLENVIEERKNRREGSRDEAARSSDFVDILLEIENIERDTLKALVLDMFLAGSETTHALMVWTMAELIKNPKILERLQTEVRQVAQGKSEVTEDDLDKMQYLKLVVKETLRLHAPLPLLVPQESSQNIKVMGYEISAGTQAFVNAWAIGRDPLLWENPAEFQPERFLNSTIDFRGLNFELIPFGSGRRSCPGASFAVAINELALAKLLQEFNFALPSEGKPEEMDMTEAPGLTMNRKLPLLLVATPYFS